MKVNKTIKRDVKTVATNSMSLDKDRRLDMKESGI